MITPNEISSKQNRTSWKNDGTDALIIENVYNELPEVFEAIILSGTPEQSNSPNVGAVTQADIQEVNDNRYYFVRVRPLITSDLQIPNPFFASNLNEAKRLINMHPLAYVEVNNTVHPPTHGDVYDCRFVNNDKMGITLISRLRNSGFKIGKVANRNIHKSYNNMSPMLQSQTPQDQPSQNDSDYGWKVKTNLHDESYDPNRWVDMLEKVIALDAMSKGDKKCSWGKRYDEVCPVDGRGIIGIAHFTQSSLNPVVDEIVAQLGEQQVVDWFGKSSEELKRVNSSCTKRGKGNPCYDKLGWWKAGWNSFVSHPQTKEIQGVVWKRKYYDESVVILEKYLAKNPKWKKTDRNICILAGIKNSAGEGGIKKHSSNGSRDPDSTLEDYVNNSHDPKHRSKRANAIDKHFP